MRLHKDASKQRDVRLGRVMGRAGPLAASMTALLLAGMASAAQAETPRPGLNLNNTSDSPWDLNAPHKTLQLDTKGRWGLRLDVDRPTNRDMNFGDVSAGAFFKITPSLRIGGTVGVGNNYVPQNQPKLAPDPGARVRVETKFQF
jgi:hypothetical protein